MNNPFRFGEAVTGECFADRENEIKDIVEYIKAGQNLFIYSYRRLGKTSLIKAVMEVLRKKKEAIAVYVDIQKVTHPAQFVEVYSEAISSALITRKEKLEKIANFFKRIVPSFEFDEKGGWKISFDFSKTKRNIEKSLEEIFELPQKIAVNCKRRVVVIFDEFQEIEGLNGESFEKKIRSFIQHHNNVCYIFMGSKTHIIMDMFNNPRRAFYKSAAVYPIDVIEDKKMVDFVYRQFHDSGKAISKEFAQEIVRVSQNIPYNVQLLSFNVWMLAENGVRKESVDNALDSVLRTQNELFFNMFDSVTLHQRAVLYALSQTKEIFSQDSILKYNLGTSSSIQSSVKSLLRNGIVHKDNKKYYIADPFFKIWIERNISI